MSTRLWQSETVDRFIDMMDRRPDSSDPDDMELLWEIAEQIESGR